MITVNETLLGMISYLIYKKEPFQFEAETMTILLDKGITINVAKNPYGMAESFVVSAYPLELFPSYNLDEIRTIYSDIKSAQSRL